jgi:uroporphyrinogen decarboxylase
MNSKERLDAIFRHEEPDRVPMTVFGSATNYHMTGVNFQEAMFRPDLVVQCVDKFQEMFPENDMIMAMAPGAMVASWMAMGAEAKILSTGWFDVTKPGVRNMEELEKLDFNAVVKNFVENKMFAAGIEATKIIDKKYGRQYPIATAWENGFTAAGRIIGTEQEMLLLINQPEFVRKLSGFMNKLWIEAGKKLIEAGATVAMIPDPNSMTMLISPKTYKEYAWPLQKETGKALKAAGCRYHLHICGNAEPLLEYIAETGADMYSHDQKTRLTEAKKRIGKKVALAGNIDPARLLFGSPEEVDRLCKECISIGGPGSGYMLSPGCDTAMVTPKANFRAMCDAALKYGKYPLKV